MLPEATGRGQHFQARVTQQVTQRDSRAESIRERARSKISARSRNQEKIK